MNHPKNNNKQIKANALCTAEWTLSGCFPILCNVHNGKCVNLYCDRVPINLQNKMSQIMINTEPNNQIQPSNVPPKPINILCPGGSLTIRLATHPRSKKASKGVCFLDIRCRKASSTFLLKKGCFFPLYRHLGVLFRKVGFEGFWPLSTLSRGYNLKDWSSINFPFYMFIWCLIPVVCISSLIMIFRVLYCVPYTQYAI